MTENAGPRICPIHPEPIELPAAEFGVCRARKDGRNLYCKACIRKKVTASRRALKEYRAARRQFGIQPSSDGQQLSLSEPTGRILSKLSPVERVRDAIREGARTQLEIFQKTRLGKDEIGDAIANLLLWTRDIKIRTVGEARHYFINDSKQQSVENEEPGIAHRKPNALASSSAMAGLMPARKWRAG